MLKSKYEYYYLTGYILKNLHKKRPDSQYILEFSRPNSIHLIHYDVENFYYRPHCIQNYENFLNSKVPLCTIIKEELHPF